MAGRPTLLERLRAEAALTQPELAERAGCSPSTITNLERRHYVRPRLRTLVIVARALSEALDRPVHYLELYDDLREPELDGKAAS
jgi:transcriptional regulator with XRE-family HTH domain